MRVHREAKLVRFISSLTADRLYHTVLRRRAALELELVRWIIADSGNGALVAADEGITPETFFCDDLAAIFSACLDAGRHGLWKLDALGHVARRLQEGGKWSCERLPGSHRARGSTWNAVALVEFANEVWMPSRAEELEGSPLVDLEVRRLSRALLEFASRQRDAEDHVRFADQILRELMLPKVKTERREMKEVAA